jgi:hypothetical protein
MIEVDFSELKKIRWREYGIRFLFGGAITVATGLIAERYGAAVGGLFLAFPAIFPASATLVEKHERDKKRRAGILKTVRGRHAAALDARGAGLGSIGLASFAVTQWKLLPVWNAALSLFAGIIVWTAVSRLVWRLHKTYHGFLRRL